MHVPDRYIAGTDEQEKRIEAESEIQEKARELEMSEEDYRNENGIEYEPLQGIVAHSDNGRWEVIVAYNPSDEFQHVSFVNSISTVKGGKHIDLVSSKITEVLREKITKEAEKQKIRKSNIKDEHIQTEMFVFVKCLIENPDFDSQSKECLKSKISQFGSEFDFDINFSD